MFFGKLFGKKKASEKVRNDRELIEENANSIDSLIVLAKDNEELVQKLRVLKEKLKYLTPLQDPKVTDYDKKIKNLIEDMRIALVKSDGGRTNKVDDALLNINLAITDRNVRA